MVQVVMTGDTGTKYSCHGEEYLAIRVPNTFQILILHNLHKVAEIRNPDLIEVTIKRLELERRICCTNTKLIKSKWMKE